MIDKLVEIAVKRVKITLNDLLGPAGVLTCGAASSCEVRAHLAPRIPARRSRLRGHTLRNASSPSRWNTSHEGLEWKGGDAQVTIDSTRQVLDAARTWHPLKAGNRNGQVPGNVWMIMSVSTMEQRVTRPSYRGRAGPVKAQPPRCAGGSAAFASHTCRSSVVGPS